MGYTPKIWNNNNEPAISADNLDHIEQGIKEAHDNIDETNVKLSNISLKKLWENEEPTNNFTAQDITLSSSDYDFLIFFCRFEGTNDLVSGMTFKGSGYKFGFGWDYNGGSGNNYYAATFRRTIEYIDDTTYNISSCYVRYSNNTTNTTTNNRLVPLYVYGGKFLEVENE